MIKPAFTRTTSYLTVLLAMSLSLTACKSSGDVIQEPEITVAQALSAETKTESAAQTAAEVRDLLINDKPLEAAIMLQDAAAGNDADREFYEKLLTAVKSQTIQSAEHGEYNYPDGSSYQWTYLYDENGHKLHGEDSYLTEDYTYDESGNMLTYIYRDSDTLSFAGSYAYEYDKDGNMTLEQSLTEDGRELTRVEYTYDRAGNCLSRKDDWGGGMFLLTQYDKNGYCKKEKRWSEGGDSHTTTYAYKLDSKDNIISLVTKQDGEVTSTETYSYEYESDERGNLTLIRRYIGAGEGLMFDYETQYEYDISDHIVKELTYRDETHTGCSVRTVTYEADGARCERLEEMYGSEVYVSTKEYLPDGQILREEADGSRTDYYYNALGHVIRLELNGEEYAFMDRTYHFIGAGEL